MAQRIALYIVRGLFILLCGGIGLSVYTYLHGSGSPVDAAPYLLAGCACGLLVVGVEVLSARGGTSTVSAIVFGLILGLVLSLLFRPLILVLFETFGAELQEGSLRFVHLVTTAVLCYFGVTLLLHTEGRFRFIIPFVEFRKEVREHQPLILDTSALVDGRIGELLQTGIIRCRVLVPRFVVEELHGLADSKDKLKRERGRRGLDLLERLRQRRQAELVESPAPGGSVDAALLELTQSMGGWLLTTDANLKARGKVQGVDVVNLNDVADAVRTMAVPGQTLSVEILREGEEKGQGVGFLPDGTMVVVEGGRSAMGRVIEVQVTGSIRTSAGRMIFAKVAKGP